MLRNWGLLIVISMAVFIGSCSKAKIIGVPDDEETLALDVGVNWLVDSIAGDTLVYTVEVEPDQDYYIQWDDLNNGTSEYTADVRVQVYGADGSKRFLKSEDHGYTYERKVSDSSTTLTVKVFATESGSFAIRIFKAELGLSVEASSSSEISSSLSSSSGVSSSGTVSSSSGTSSSSVSSSGSSSSMGSSSSVIISNGGALAVGRTWTKGLAVYGDTLVYTLSVESGKTYYLQWMDDYNNNPAELTGMDYPTGDIMVSATDGSGLVHFSYSDYGSTPISVVAASSTITLKVRTTFSYSQGTFYLRAYQTQSTKKSLAVSTTMKLDTISFVSDTIVYSVNVTPGSSYRVQWADYTQGTLSETGDVSVSARDSSGSSYWNGTTYSNGYTSPYALVPSTSRIWLKVVSTSRAGSFRIRIYEVQNPRYKEGAIGSTWNQDTLSTGTASETDTVIYKFPVTSGKQYLLSTSEYDGGSSIIGYAADIKFVYVQKGTTWPSMGSAYYSSYYTTPLTINATADSLFVKVTTEYSTTYAGAWGIRLVEYVPPVPRLLLPSTTWDVDTLAVGADTLIYKIPTTVGTSYRIHLNDSYSGTSTYSAIIYMSYKTKSATTWTGPSLSSYTSPTTIVATEDTMMVRITPYSSGYQGTFAIRILSVVNIIKDMTPGTSWVPDTIPVYGDTTVFKYVVTPGKTYQIWSADYDYGPNQYGTGIADIKFNYKDGDDLTWSTFYSYAYTTAQNFIPTTDTLFVKVTPEASSNPGRYEMKVNEKVTTIHKPLALGMTWDPDTLQAADTVVYHVDVDPSKTYRIQFDEYGTGSGLYTGYVKMYYQETGATDWGVVYLDGYNVSILSTTSGGADSLLVKMIGNTMSSTGTYGVRVYEAMSVTKEASLGMAWDRDTLAGGDSILYRLPTTIGHTYRIQWADNAQYDSTGLTSNASAAIYNKAGVLMAWTSGSTASQADGYGYARTFVATEDSMMFRFFGTGGVFKYRVYDAEVMFAKDTIQVGDSYLDGSVQSGDTLLYKVPVVVGNEYQVQWNDAIQGNGTKTGKVYVSAGSSMATLTNYFTYSSGGYTTLRKVSATTDTMYVRVAASALSAAGGNFAIRVVDFVPINLPLTNLGWTEGVTTTGGVYYRVSVTPGTVYRVRWDDSWSGSGSYSSDIYVSLSQNGSTWGSNYDSGYNTTVTFTPTGSYMYILVTGGTGTFAIQAFPY